MGDGDFLNNVCHGNISFNKIFAMTKRTGSPVNPVPVAVHNALQSMADRAAVARKARNLTQADLARLSSVGLSTISSIEAGHDGVTLASLLKVLAALDLLDQADQLFCLEKDSALIEYGRERLSKWGRGRR